MSNSRRQQAHFVGKKTLSDATLDDALEFISSGECPLTSYVTKMTMVANGR